MGAPFTSKKVRVSEVKAATSVTPALYLDRLINRDCLPIAGCRERRVQIAPDAQALFCRRRHQLRRPEFFYRSQFHSTVSNLCRLQPARYITTAHSSLCSETMSLRGRGKDGSASGACEAPTRHEPLGGSGHYEMPTEFQIERYKSALATDQLVMTRSFPHAFLCAS